jgi:hypothetical protein
MFGKGYTKDPPSHKDFWFKMLPPWLVAVYLIIKLVDWLLGHSMSLSIPTCSAGGTVSAANKRHTLCGNARDYRLKRCGFFGRSIFVLNLGRIISAGVEFEVT